MSETSQSKISLKIVLAIFVFALGLVQLYRFYWPRVTITLAGKTLEVEVADNGFRQTKGLGGRDQMGRYDGMLFIFPSAAPYAFIMRDTRFPLDIIWFDQGRVVDIAPDVQPEPGVPEADLRRYAPRKPANAVLEVPAGWVAKNGLKIGDLLQVKGD